MNNGRMKFAVLIGFSLSFSGWALANTYGLDPKLAVTITTSTGKTVVVKGPKVDLDFDTWWRWKVSNILKSPNEKFTAVLYYGSAIKYWSAAVFLIRPDGTVEELKNGEVRKTQWTEDGIYLVGTGDNTIRLWNLNGGVRQVSFPNIRASRVMGKTLCLNVNWYSPTTGQVSRTAEIHLAIPSLKQVSDKDTDGNATCEPQS